MITNSPLFQVYSAMARHASESLKVSSTNIAHADDPGYKAGKIESFETYLARIGSRGSSDAAASSFRILMADTPASPDGNNVSLEHEVFASADAMEQHNLALAVYTKSMDLLRTAIGKR